MRVRRTGSEERPGVFSFLPRVRPSFWFLAHKTGTDTETEWASHQVRTIPHHKTLEGLTGNTANGSLGSRSACQQRAMASDHLRPHRLTHHPLHTRGRGGEGKLCNVPLSRACRYAIAVELTAHPSTRPTSHLCLDGYLTRASCRLSFPDALSSRFCCSVPTVCMCTRV